jgi:hypothetical protein
VKSKNNSDKSYNKLKNPFIFGKVVTGENFTDRAQELSELKRDLRNKVNIVLYGPRRYGKTSLIFQLFQSLKKDDPNTITVYIDFYRIYSKEKFIKVFAESCSQAIGWQPSKLLEFFKNIVKSIVPRLSIDRDGKPVLDINFNPSESDKVLSEVMQIPSKLAESGKNVCIAMDEFQEISKMNGDAFLKELRSYIQLQGDVSYIFAGSKTHLMKEIFANRDNPFYNIGKIKYIGKIGSSELSNFLVDRSTKAGKPFPRNIANEICRKCDSIPYYTQMLAYEVFNVASSINEYTEESIADAMELLLSSKNEEYIAIWDNLSLNQKKVIEIIIKTNGINLYTSRVLSEYHIAASTLNKSITELKHKNIVYAEGKKIHFSDVFFKEWLNKAII